MVALLFATAHAARRPRYGGTLRIALRAAVSAINPADSSGDSVRLTALVYDTLLTADDTGALQPGLARAWSSDATFNRWQFWLRRNVEFHDGEPLTPELAAAFFANTVPGCKTSAIGDSVVFQCAAAQPSLAAQMPSLRFAITHRGTSGKLEGTGPFVLAEFEPGKHAVFTAFEDCWAGRPYLDRIEVTLGQDYRDQALALQLGRVDVVELGTADSNLVLRSSMTAPVDLVALVFSRTGRSVADERTREAVSLALDRAAIADVLLQGRAEAATGLLPNWISGYESLFNQPHDLAQARELRNEARPGPIAFAVSPGDAELRLVAERIALNLRDAGFGVQLTADAQHADVLLASIVMGSADPEAALANVASALHAPAPQFHDDSLDAAFRAERELLRGHWSIPILHLSHTIALSPRVRNWADRQDGDWRLPDVWVDAVPAQSPAAHEKPPGTPTQAQERYP